MASKGVKLTDEHKAKLSLAAKKRCDVSLMAALGRMRKGKKHSAESKLRMSEAHKGKELSNDHKAAIRAKAIGRHVSEGTRRKHSLAWTQEQRKNQSVAITKLNKTRVWTLSARLAAAVRATNALVSKSRTSLEINVAKKLQGHCYQEQAKIPGDPWHLWDFVLPGDKLLIEADGCYWHGCKSCGHPGVAANRATDKAKNTIAKRLGWRLIRVKECELQSFSLRCC